MTTLRDRLAPTGADAIEIVGPSSFETGVKVRYLATGTVSTIAREHVESVEAPAPPAPDPKPFYVYTRLYKANGDCEKRVHHFATRRAQTAFMRRTHRAITAWN